MIAFKSKLIAKCNLLGALAKKSVDSVNYRLKLKSAKLKSVPGGELKEKKGKDKK